MKETRETLYVVIIGVLAVIFGILAMVNKPYYNDNKDKISSEYYMEYYLEEFYGN